MDEMQLRKRKKLENGNKSIVKDQTPIQTTQHDGKMWKLLRFCFSICFNAIKYLVMAILLVAFLNYTALIKEERELKPKGEFVKTNEGQSFYMKCQGQGKPTVILDAPNGMNSDVWAFVTPQLADATKVCVFDRAGLGFSDRPGKNLSATRGMHHTVERMTEDLREVFVTQGKVERPYVLVGVEVGAISAKFYAQMYPSDMASLVLINPYHDNLFDMEGGIWTKYWFGSVLPSLQLRHFASVFGFTRIFVHLNLLKEIFNEYEVDDTMKKRQRYLMCKPGHVSTAVEESFMVNTSLSQLRLIHKLRQFPPNLPTTIISSDRYNEFAGAPVNQVWQKSQELIPTTFPKPIGVQKSKATADRVLLEDPETVSQTILKVITEWKKSSQKEDKY